MLLRRVRITLAAARCFSAAAEVEAVAAPKKPALSDGGSVTRKKTFSGGDDTLSRRLLSLVYSRRSAVITIRQWKEEGRGVQKYELHRIIRELGKVKRYQHALEIFEWMNTQNDIKLHEGDYALHLNIISKVHGLTTAEKFFEDLPDRLKGQFTYTALLHAYVQHKETSNAEDVLKKMSDRGFLKHPLAYNHMISLYISNKQPDKVFDLYEELLKNTQPNAVTLNQLLSASALQNDVEAAEKHFLKFKDAKLEPDWITFSTMTSLYTKMSLLDKAAVSVKEVEKRISRKVRTAHSSLISLHTNMGNKNEVNRLWKKMKSLFIKLKDSEYICMISSLVKLEDLEEAEKVYTEWESVSPTRDPRVANLLLGAYINTNQMEMAEKFHDRMVKRRIKRCYTTWELLVWGYLNEKQTNKALECLNKAIASVSKWNPDEKIIGELFKNLEEFGNVEEAEQFLDTLRKVGYVNTEVYNSLLRTYAKAGKMAPIVAERMEKDNVEADDETCELIELTSEMHVSEVS